MAARLAHRGPDEQGIYEDKLGFRRLSIIDLRGGSQPMKGCGELRLSSTARSTTSASCAPR